MKRNPLYWKGFVITVIVLFVVVSTVPVINGNSRRLNDIKNDFDIIGARWNIGTTSKNILSNREIFLPSSNDNIKNGNEPLGCLGPEDDIYNQSMFDVYEVAEFGLIAWGLTSADFNSDGNIDFAVSSAISPFNYSTISIFYNDGYLNFTRNDVYTVNFYLRYVKDLDSGDYDNDGDIDLIFTYSEYEYFGGLPFNIYGVTSILFNDGNNHFGNETMIARRGSGEPRDPEGRINPQLTSADYDKDGDIDLLVGDNSGKVEFYLNDGTGNFTSGGIIHDFGHNSWGLTSADFDGDGDIDFIVAAEWGAHQAYGNYYLKRNNGLSTCFEPDGGEIIGDLYYISASLASLDYNNDGNIDFIAGIWNEAFLFMNNNGIYEPFLIGKFPDDPTNGGSEMLTYGGLTTADYNYDGWTDFITGGDQGIIRLFVNKGNGHIPPDKPTIIGSVSGKAGKEYEYTFIVEDLNGDDIYLYVDWVNNETGWLGPFPSGEEIVLSHSWDEGRYYVRAKAKDIHGDESNWATLDISMPKNKHSTNTLFLRFLEKFPNMSPLLKYLLRS